MIRSVPAAAFLLCALLIRATPASGGAAERVVVAIENRSDEPRAVELVTPSFDGVLSRKGYEVVLDSTVSDFLAAMKIARVDPLPAGMADKLLLRFRADVLLTVTIDYLLESKPRARGPKASTAIGMSAKLLGPEGRVLWRSSLGVTGTTQATFNEGCDRLLFTLRRAKSRPAEVVADEQGPDRRGPRFSLGGSRDAKARLAEEAAKEAKRKRKRPPQADAPAPAAR